MDRKAFVAAIAVAAMWSHAAIARADGVAILPPSTRQGVDRALARRVGAVVEDRLRARGFDVIGIAETQRRIESAAIGCDPETSECAPAIAAAIGTEYACEVVVWGARGTHPPQLVIALTTRTGEAGGAEVDLADGVTVADAVDEAIARALADLEAPRGVVVFISGEPAGASIVIDGQPIGQLPWNGLVSVGMHELVVSHHGHLEHHETFEVAPPEVRLELALTRDQASGSVGDTTAPTRTERVTYRPIENVVGPIALGVIGLGFLTVDAVTLAMLGCSEEAPFAGGRCVHEQRIDEMPFAIYGAIGVASIVGAIVWFAVGERTEERVVTVRAGLGLGSLRVEGTW